MPRLTVVIPTREQPTPQWRQTNVTIRTLQEQNYRDFEEITIWDQDRRGAAWARNAGFALAKTELVLFSDDDITWMPRGIQAMIETLDREPAAAYSYGAYICDWKQPGRLYTIGACPFDPDRLRYSNYISTMTVIRAKDFPGFDETLKRYQDWDLWLTMLASGKAGAYCGEVIFETRLRHNGITHASIPIAEAREAIKRKHNL
jgi:glycosyltransferase involved in cell wall biosynthesis